MDTWKIIEAVFIIGVMAALCRVERKDPEQARRVLANSFVWTVGAASPFALIELLSVFGVRLLDAPWVITPLDGMCAAALLALFVLSGRKLFGFVRAEG